MSAAKTVSITLPPDLLRKAEERAVRESATMDELFGYALNRYLDSDPEWEAVLRETRAAGRRLGIESEEDVERLSDEYRRERRR